MLHVIVGDHAAAELSGSGFGQRHHPLGAYRIVDNFFTFNPSAKHSADLWRNLQHLGHASPASDAKIVAGSTAFSMKEGSGALSSCDCFFEIRSVGKDDFDKAFRDFTSARIRFATVATEQRHEFLRNNQTDQIPLFIAAYFEEVET